MKSTTESRLISYAWEFKKHILLGLLFLALAVGFELTGPFIAKTIIDNHIVAIEGSWSEVSHKENADASYKSRYFTRTDRLVPDQKVIKEQTILQVGNDFYLVDGTAPTSGKRTISKNQLQIKQLDKTLEFNAIKLTDKEIYKFFKMDKKPIFIWLGIYLLLLFFSSIFKFFETFLLQKSANLIVQKMRNDLFSHIQRLPINYFVKHPAGSIVSRVTNDTEAIRDLYERVLSIVLTSIMYMLGIFIALLFLNVKLALFSLLLIPILYAWMLLYKIYGTKFNVVIRSTLSKINSNISEAIQGMSVIRAFGQSKRMQKEFEVLNARHFKFQRKLLQLNSVTSFNLVTVIKNTTFLAFIWYFGVASMNPENIISIGLLYAFVDYMTRLFEPVTNIVNQLPLIEQARVAGTRVFKILDEDGESLKTTAIPRYEGKIAFKNVSFSYDGSNQVLKEINFEIPSGKTAAFVGHTGSGKSTIMNLLFRFYDYDSGIITIDQQDIKNLSRQQVRSHMGIVLQDPFLFTGSIITNVTLNDDRISREKAMQALKLIDADVFIEKLPKQYDTIVTEGGGTFSLGERQLISFARALAFDPAILILDEATANIDSETENIIQNALNILKQGRTTLIIAHRLSTIQQADVIYVLDHGVIKESGNHQELIQTEGIYKHMYNMQKMKADLIS